jgi:hypothetical protein
MKKLFYLLIIINLIISCKKKENKPAIVDNINNILDAKSILTNKNIHVVKFHNFYNGQLTDTISNHYFSQPFDSLVIKPNGYFIWFKFNYQEKGNIVFNMQTFRQNHNYNFTFDTGRVVIIKDSLFFNNSTRIVSKVKLFNYSLFNNGNYMIGNKNNYLYSIIIE